MTNDNTHQAGTPTLSIITVNFNNNTGLKKTLKSIKKQSFKNFEHIIIDADSTDGSKNTIAKYNEEENNHLTYWVSEKDKGIYDGMNKGIKQAKGEYFYFLNSGDCLQDDILKEVNFDGTQYIYGDMVLDEEKGKRDRIAPDEPNLVFFFFDSLSHQSCFIHKSLFLDKLYDTRYRIISDWAHSVESIILKDCSYRHIHFVIAECDATGISSDYLSVQTERIKWFKENFSEQLYATLIDLLEYRKSPFSNIIPEMNKTRKFQKRAYKLIKILFKIHIIFSIKSKNTDIRKTLFYRPFYVK